MGKINKSNKRAFIVLLCGISIQIAGWFGEHSVEIPFILKIVAPNYYHARKGLETLLKVHSLNNSDDGFKQLAPFALRYFRDQDGVSTNITDLSVTKLILATKFSPDGKAHFATSMVVLYFSTSNTKIIGNNFETMQFDRLKDDAETLREPNIIVFCLSLFLIGTFVDILAFFVESAEPNSQIEENQIEQESKSAEKKDQK